jgi:hypothetical protein
MCQISSVAKKGNVRKLEAEARNYVLWRVQCCAYAFWNKWVQWIILRKLINLNMDGYGIYLRNISLFPYVCICAFWQGKRS